MTKFIKVRNLWINVEHITMVKKTTPSKGADGVSRQFVVSLSLEAEPNKDYNRIWASEKEAKELLEFLNYKPSSDDAVSGELISKPKSSEEIDEPDF